MIQLLLLSLILFALGAIVYFRLTLSYILGFAGSLLVFIIGCYGLTQTQIAEGYSISNHVVLQLSVDHLSGIFMIIASISWMALSIYSIDYSKATLQKSIALGFNICLIGMILILTAKDGLTLLIGWEVMTIAAFAMMLTHENNFERCFRFLAFGELSTVFLLLGFAVLFKESGGLSFDAMKNGSPLLLVLLSLGFIIKMDIVPFHGWMRSAYGEIPDNTAALLSAPVTLMGVYGLERIVMLIPANNTWNIIMVLLGAFSAFWGGMQAVATNKMRLLPAYSTIENNGMILTAIGLYALSFGSSNAVLNYLSLFALATSIIIAISHTLAKTLLFMSVGHVKAVYNVHTIDEARGVWSGVGKIPALGIVISALSFSAFPPLIGYAGEWMLLETLFQSYRFPNGVVAFFAALAGILTALAIGLIGFAMIKLIGYTALGYDHGRTSRKVPNKLMHFTEIMMEIILVAGGIGLPVIIIVTGFPNLLTGLLAVPAPLLLASNEPLFGVISPPFIAIIMVVLFIIPFWILIRNRKSVRKVNAWNGGTRIEEENYFSAQAYSQILEHILRNFYRTKELRSTTRRSLEVEDILVRPTLALTRFVHKIGEGESFLIMNGKISVYVTYILVLFILVFFIGMIVM